MENNCPSWKIDTECLGTRSTVGEELSRRGSEVSGRYRCAYLPGSSEVGVGSKS